MSDFICPYVCSYKTNSGYCGRTGGAESCQYRLIDHAHGVDATVFAVAQMTKPLTNADLYRAYSDEQIAELFSQIETDGKAYGPRGKAAWLDWLKQEASE